MFKRFLFLQRFRRCVKILSDDYKSFLRGYVKNYFFDLLQFCDDDEIDVFSKEIYDICFDKDLTFEYKIIRISALREQKKNFFKTQLRGIINND